MAGHVLWGLWFWTLGYNWGWFMRFLWTKSETVPIQTEEFI